MTREDKELLLKDLSARLPYKVIVDYSYNAFHVRNGNYVKHGSKCILSCYLLDVFMSPRQNEKGEYIKPYLRSLSSMTEEEKVQLSQYACIGEDLNGEFIDEVQRNDCAAYIDWLNKHHFDYRGLIEKGIAIEAPEGMY